MKTVIQIVRYEDGKVTYEVDVTGLSERRADKVERGMNINLNSDHFYTRFQEVEELTFIKQ